MKSLPPPPPEEPKLSSLRADVPSLPRSFVDQVMRRAGLLGRPRSPRRSWLTRRLQVSFALRPVFLTGLAGATALFAAARVADEPASSVAEYAAERAVLVRFALPAPQADKVFLVGDFNDWATDRIALRRGLDGIWTTTLPLPPGTFQYAYVVDGRFVVDPLAERQRPDGFGGYNAVLRVSAPGS